ncbi:MAG: histidine phosphatase family protein [Pseudomonadota bacterium]
MNPRNVADRRNVPDELERASFGVKPGLKGYVKMFPIYVLRHGQTEWNAEGRYQGHKNSPLTALGRYQAFRQGEILRSKAIAASVWASPIGRARDTALIATAHMKTKTQFDDDLKEITMGAFDGLTKDEIVERYPEFDPYVKGWTAEDYGGENNADVYARARAVLQRLEGPTILVTHGVYSRYLRGIILGLSHEDAMWLPQEQGCIYALENGEEEIWAE